MLLVYVAFMGKTQHTVNQDRSLCSNLEPIIIGSRFVKTQQQFDIIHRMFLKKGSNNYVTSVYSFKIQ